jgi:hypothetical protein
MRPWSACFILSPSSSCLPHLHAGFIPGMLDESTSASSMRSSRLSSSRVRTRMRGRRRRLAAGGLRTEASSSLSYTSFIIQKHVCFYSVMRIRDCLFHSPILLREVRIDYAIHLFFARFGDLETLYPSSIFQGRKESLVFLCTRSYRRIWFTGEYNIAKQALRCRNGPGVIG